MAKESEVPPLLEQVLELHEARERKGHSQPPAEPPAVQEPAPVAAEQPGDETPAAAPDEAPDKPPPDFDPNAAIIALFGDNKRRLVPLGFIGHELDELDAFDPTLDVVVPLDEPELDDVYEFTPATNLN